MPTRPLCPVYSSSRTAAWSSAALCQAAIALGLVWAAMRVTRMLRVADSPLCSELNFGVEYRLLPFLDWPSVHWFKTSQ